MCSFLVSNRRDIDVDFVNFFLKWRGPDATNYEKRESVHFLHNLLSLTGEYTKQPITQTDGEVVCVFNGEIYNSEAFGHDLPSDGYSIIRAYKEFGLAFATHLDGEFAIVLVDFSRRLLVCATDPFATKPMWVAIEGRQFGIATYKSGLERMGFRECIKADANTTTSYSIDTLTKLAESQVVRFETRQYKTDFADWIFAFQEAVRKRVTQSPKAKIFVGLSSGYDSGAIVNELTQQRADFKAFSILGAEHEALVRARHKLIENGEIVHVKRREYIQQKLRLKRKCENYVQRREIGDYDIKRDRASIGLAIICSRGINEGRRVLLSGHGADEIISDYGHAGRRLSVCSQFGGLFPSDLGALFPWNNFYGGSLQMYLAKEEYVAGSFGVESRYPFLDRKVVQEFLSLDYRLKNMHYKAPIREYLMQNRYPFSPNEKIGFMVRQKRQRVQNR